MTQRLLLLEDDPPTRLYLREILAKMGFAVSEQDSLRAARDALAAQRFDLWLCDANLPDGGAAELVTDPHYANIRPPAVAMTADHDPLRASALIDAGFLMVLHKPVDATALRNAVAACLPESQPVWDEAHALAAAAGIESTRAALRQLFLAELPKIETEVIAAFENGNNGHLHSLLHRLRGSSALVGAHRLHACAGRLSRSPHDHGALESLRKACRQTLAARRNPQPS